MITKAYRTFVRLSVFSLASLFLVSCSDFFDPSTDDEFDGEKGYTTTTEMSTGFLGILAKVQAVGDKEILLTEPRGELIEPSEQSNSELIALYNYDSNLQENSYANPKGYYEVVIACNDYLKQMEKYKSNPNVDTELWNAFVASALRVKVWVYKTLGEIYGEAIWFDDAADQTTELKLGDKFQKMDMQQLTDKCLSLLESGYEGVDLKTEVDWVTLMDPDNISSPASSTYYYWNSNIPHYPGLLAELLLWKAAYLDAAGEDTKSLYKEAADVLLAAVNKYINDQSTSGNPGYWIPSTPIAGKYSRFWDNTTPYRQEGVTAITYNYQTNQTNTLLKHFSDEFPNKYWLRPSVAGMERYIDNTFNPGTAKNHARYTSTFGNRESETPYIAKFRPKGSTYRSEAYQDDVHIYIYRAMQYHLMIIEALNHLMRFEAMEICLNNGFAAFQPEVFETDKTGEYEGFNRNWTKQAEWGNRSYAHAGIRGQYTLSARNVKTNIYELGKEKTLHYNDMQILDEVMLEFGCEGKVYPWMNRMAVRYNDPSIVADRVCPKYTDEALAASVREKIMDGGYWVKYDLGIE